MKLASFLILATIGGILALWVPHVRVKLEIYDVQEIVGGGGDFGSSFGDSPDDRLPAGAIGTYEFANRVKSAVRPQEWEQKRQWSVQCQNGLLIVRAPACVQREVEAYVDGARKSGK